MVWAVPVSRIETLVLFVALRPRSQRWPYRFLLNTVDRLVLHEDRRAIESQSPGPIEEAIHELNVPTDVGSLAFRDWYNKHCASSSAMMGPG